MLDPKLLRSQGEQIFERLKCRGADYDFDHYHALEVQRKALQVEVEETQAHLNAQSQEIAQLQSNKSELPARLQQAEKLKQHLGERRARLASVQDELNAFLLGLPNIPDASVAVGQDESDNVEVRRWGALPTVDFDALDHVALAKRAGWLDMAAAATIAGARFAVLHADLARLQRALIHFMLDLHIREHGYREVYVPYIVNRAALTGTGQLPKFESDLFKLAGEHHLYLTPTAEVPVTNLCSNTILQAEQLPLRYVCHTPCFRSEAGAYGKDTHGLMRQHQFEKVELVQIVHAEQSWHALEELTTHAEAVLQKLELPYRVVSLCSGDLGFASAKTYDLEVWVPSEQRYREISSCSNMLDFQARRIKARVRNDSGKPVLVHTLNGSGLAVGRTLLALMENHQTADRTIAIPTALQPYMENRTTIGAKTSDNDS